MCEAVFHSAWFESSDVLVCASSAESHANKGNTLVRALLSGTVSKQRLFESKSRHGFWRGNFFLPAEIQVRGVSVAQQYRPASVYSETIPEPMPRTENAYSPERNRRRIG
jgi:hypothetical protein